MREFNRLPALVADDNTDDCLIAMEAWEENEKGSDLNFVQDGIECLDYLYQRGRFIQPETSPIPGIILLDLKIPKKNGWEILSEIKADPFLQHIPVIVLSTSHSPNEISSIFSLGAYDFVTKPQTFQEYLYIMRNLHHVWMQLTKAEERPKTSQPYLPSELALTAS